MKLFTEAGSDAKMCVLFYSTAYYDPRIKRIRDFFRNITIGFLLGELIVYMSGLEAPWLFFSACGLVIAAGYCVALLLSVFKRQGLIIASTPEMESSFMVSKWQIMWVTPNGEVPVFDLKGYKIRKQKKGSGESYICYGNAGAALTQKVRKMMVGERVWACKKLMIMLRPESTEYAEAVELLEYKAGEGRGK